MQNSILDRNKTISMQLMRKMNPWSDSLIQSNTTLWLVVLPRYAGMCDQIQEDNSNNKRKDGRLLIIS